MRTRVEIKQEAKALIRVARVSPLLISAIVVVACQLMNDISLRLDPNADAYEDILYAIEQGESYITDEISPAATFASVMVSLVTTLLYAGYYSYCMGIRRGEEMRAGSLLSWAAATALV